jgi:hypothetical protein
MNCGKKIMLVATLFGLLFSTVSCQDFLKEGVPVEEFEVNILTEAESVRTRLGDYLGGYLAEYELDFQKHRIFAAFEIQKYEKGERLRVIGRFTDDYVRMSYGDQINADFPVFRIQRAKPATLEKKVGQIVSVMRLPR